MFRLRFCWLSYFTSRAQMRQTDLGGSKKKKCSFWFDVCDQSHSCGIVEEFILLTCAWNNNCPDKWCVDTRTELYIAAMNTFLSHRQRWENCNKISQLACQSSDFSGYIFLWACHIIFCIWVLKVSSFLNKEPACGQRWSVYVCLFGS